MNGGLRGRGLREKVLTALGAGELYEAIRKAKDDAAAAQATAPLLQAAYIVDLQRRLDEASQARSDIERVLAAETERRVEMERRLAAEIERFQNEKRAREVEAREGVEAVKSLRERLAHFEGLKGADRLIELDFAVRPRIRHGWDQPSEPRLQKIIEAGERHYVDAMRAMQPMVDTASRILPRTDKPSEPHWINDWLPAFDAFSIYSFLVLRNPPLYLEIGSGTSTKFARRAIADHGLRTRIVSIDPYPRSEIDALCDIVIRTPLEETPPSAFEALGTDDVVFFDGSHRSFQNSDATVFFTEVLPSLPSGTLAGVHDIFLPDDYPKDWLRRFYSEQYLLACWLLAGKRLKIELAIWYCSRTPSLLSHLDAVWKAPNLDGANIAGGIFWFTQTHGN